MQYAGRMLTSCFFLHVWRVSLMNLYGWRLHEHVVQYLFDGLGSNGGVDGNLLKKIANDPIGARYNSSQPAGKYYFSPNAGQLGAAFNAIASEILRIYQ